MSMSRKTAVGMLSSAAAALAIAAPCTAHADNVYGSAMIEPTFVGDVQTGANFYASWSSHSQEEADDMAARQCGTRPGGGPECDRYLQWVNGCAAIASRGVDYRSAVAPTRGEAEQAALAAANAGAGLPTGSAFSLPAGIVVTYCLPNAG